VPPIGRYLGFTPLPPGYWPLSIATLVADLAVTQGMKMWLLRRGWI